MLRLLLVIFFLSSAVFSFSQQDFLQLKKRNRTIKTYFKGSYITFQTNGMQWLNGRIYKLTKDSVYLYQIDIGMRPNMFGLGSVADTTVLGVIGLAMNNFYAIPNEHQSYWPKIGSLIQIGAAGYVGLNLINAAVNKEPVFDDRNKKRLAGAGAAFLLGVLLKQTDPETYKLGRKYKLVYVHVTP